MDVLIQGIITILAVGCAIYGSKANGKQCTLMANVYALILSVIGITQNWSITTPMEVNGTLVSVAQHSETLPYLFYGIIIFSLIFIILNLLLISIDYKNRRWDDEN